MTVTPSGAAAPSSLAGGSFGRDQSTLADLTRTLEMCERGEGHNPEMVSVHVSTFRDLLAALSPEAPAREGVGWSVCEAEMHLSKLESLQPAVNIGRPDASAALEWARERLAALTPRHEAPACKNKGGDVDQLSAGCLVPGCASEMGETCKGPANA